MATRSYDHKHIEATAQEKWRADNLYQADISDSSDVSYYLLVEFPYPSGDLHIGHWYAFAMPDIYARVLRMQGKNVLFPIGFDAFGLPAENAAIKRGLDPKKWTYDNMNVMRAQLRHMGASFDWSKEVVTCEPEYYRWTQWLFTKLYEHDLAYRANASVKWCPKDKTVLANEQVANGFCERCGTEVEERHLTQWFLRITNYADRLLKDLDELPWKEDIKDAQSAWIGKSTGAYLAFKISSQEDPLRVFTTRPDTIYGVTYVVVAPEHPLVKKLIDDGSISNVKEVQEYLEKTARKTERERSENKEKTGVVLEGVTATHPATKKIIPIYIADYVIGSYGTGAVMAVPAHDERDFDFAYVHGLPCVVVIKATDNDTLPMTRAGKLVNSDSFSGRDSVEAQTDMIDAVGGESATQYRLRDWLISRQRYWGCPIPIVYDPQGNPHAIPEEHLPWKLPTDIDFAPTGKSPLATSVELLERTERIFGKGWKPECDTFDTFVDSSWYFLRYLDCKNADAFSSSVAMKKWLPVDRYSGGSEHTTMHLLYARFFHKALYDLGFVPTKEPFNERFNRGIIMGPDGHKMSKSKGNVINPDDFVKKYGADAVRIYLAFIGPYNEAGSYPWNLDGVKSMRRFLERVYALEEKVADIPEQNEITVMLSQTAEKVSEDAQRFKFNTAISALMIALRALEGGASLAKESYLTFLKLLAPFAPHLTEHVWELLAQEGSIHSVSWPQSAVAKASESDTVVVQINGKRRGEITLPIGADENTAFASASNIPFVAEALKNGKPKRIIYVPGRIINLVL
ncbi:MAG TPA: leucine--tRNA ligase [Candidatus Kaiserbacteria bacterium]|nr:leucine--tRNA ligase [Candidatus Kaiserbacteria bacterium]